MPKFNVEIPHQLTADEARSRLERFAEAMQAKFDDKVSDLSQSWNGDSLSFGFKTFGIKISGDIACRDEKLVVNGDLPLTAMMFKGKIESEMRELLGRFMR
ncbi:MAG: polyhydroxyalkanoic acid system family protein [Pirellulales bacterium]|nr:polyhydroxyalkanoic acid system family protein [Pirellulales bacterium]